MYKPKFPKPTRKKKSRVKKAKTPEAYLQSQIDSLLALRGIKFIRVPDLVYRLCGWGNNKLKPWEKVALSQAFKGLPDNILMMGDLKGKYFVGMNLENKSDVGKQSAGQKKWAKELPVNVMRTFEEAEKAVNEFEVFVDWVETALEEASDDV